MGVASQSCFPCEISEYMKTSRVLDLLTMVGKRDGPLTLWGRIIFRNVFGPESAETSVSLPCHWAVIRAHLSLGPFVTGPT